MQITKRLSAIILVIAIVILARIGLAQENTIFTEEEQKLIRSTQQGQPLKIGIIPHAFPLSVCPPEAPEFMGMNIEMLKLISEASGLQFEYHRIPLETLSPYQILQQGNLDLVAGSIRLESFVRDPKLLLSDRFCDGAAICIARRDTDANIFQTGKVAVLHGYQAGEEFSRKQFPNHEIVLYTNNKDVIQAVRLGDADLAMISRYVGVYELQSPFNEDLIMLEPYQMLSDSCIMGRNTPHIQTALSIVNKALRRIGANQANHVQMNFSITHPYRPTLGEYIFKYRYVVLFVLATCCLLGIVTFKLWLSRKESNLLALDQLTGALSEAGFELEARKTIDKFDGKFFIVDFDISHFSAYNELHGKEQGDELLQRIVTIVRSFLWKQDIICRSYADNFKVLVCKENIADLIDDIQKANTLFSQILDNRMAFTFGIYPITDKQLSMRKMLGFAAMAKKNVKKSSADFIGIFDDNLYERYIQDSKLLAMFDRAIASGQFVPYYQPKFDTHTSNIAGAEALVRWQISDDQLIPPYQFIDLFEANGLIQRLDFYMLDKVCLLQQQLLKQGVQPIPISVNFSRVHLFSGDFVNTLNNVVEQHAIPQHLIEIECTETAIAYDKALSGQILGQLRAHGFKIAMDDFGQAYSSLNTLRMMSLDVVKLDKGFLSTTNEEEKEKSRKIITNIVKLLHELSVKTVAEGVETKEQYLFMKSAGCDYIQGYYFSKPVPQEQFVQLLTADRQHGSL